MMRCTCGMEVVVVAVVVVLDNGRMDLAKRRSMAECGGEGSMHSCSVQVVWELYLPCTGSVIIYDDS